MTPEQLYEIVQTGETLDVEFKGELHGTLSDKDLVEAVVCLANRLGTSTGWLLLGVEDDGRITGARPRHEANITDPLRLQALIANKTRPSLSCRVETIVIDGHNVTAIAVPAVPAPVGTAGGLYIRRTIGGNGKPQCMPFHFHEMQAQIADHGTQDYSAFLVPEARWEDLDPLEFERFRRTIRESRGTSDNALLELSDVELARALGAVEASGDAIRIRVAGLLLFGREVALSRHLPTHEIAFQMLSGDRIESNDFFRWPLVRAVGALMQAFRTRNRETELMVGMLHIGVPDYPETAFREAIANALIHRDYTRRGAVHVQWHQDRMEISNPGGLPDGVRVDNILSTAPRPRNPLLTDAFKRAGIVERTARGVDRIYHEQLRNGRPAPMYDRTTSTDVVLILPGGKANTNFVRLVTEQNQTDEPFRLDELLLLNDLCLERTVDVTGAARLLQKSDPEARAVLQRLVEAGFLEARGERRGRNYHLSAATYRRLGDKVGYVRQRGFEPLQQEQMAIQYTQKHGRITRRELADLCQLSPSQARNLLARMVRKNTLELHGTRKGAFYTFMK